LTAAPLLLDNSAWARLSRPSTPEPRIAQFAADLEARRLGVCLPFMLEAADSAPDALDHAELMADLEELPRFPFDVECERRALTAHIQLSRIGHHRIPAVDVMIAAIADRHGVGVLHYDSDYDLLREKTGLEFHSEWLAPRGSL
jgi:predicted nucleic acid-binding protein